MVSEIGFADTLSLAQTIGIVGTLVLTLYFSKRHIQALSSETETRVLNEMDEKTHNMIELVLERPSLSKVMDNLEPNTSESGQYLFSYYILLICSQAFVMRRRNMLKESEWRPYVQLMKNCFQRGTISEIWRRIEEDRWFDPAFQQFINTEITKGNR
jgi:hypothetical protein